MKENLFKKAIASRKLTEEEPEPVQKVETSQSMPALPKVKEPKVDPVAPQAEPKKRGRPATGKRSDEAWIGRTYYVKRETDLDVEEMLLQLRRQGIEVDKSELVDLLLAAWVKWQKGDNIERQISEITPRRK
ncbi:hypothetical protein [Floridanema evergladense]|uniref:Uncharacterized protein n=1 Tax=Floridaenema evergladense BLCC-F167 TaxID=3153639 RepID=A0ABV4WDC8_9CYAN